MRFEKHEVKIGRRARHFIERAEGAGCIIYTGGPHGGITVWTEDREAPLRVDLNMPNDRVMKAHMRRLQSILPSKIPSPN